MPIILLENVRSTFNVGSVFRVASAVGAECVVLVGYTPAPIDRMKRINEQLNKTSLGAEKTVPWQQYKTTGEALRNFPKHTPIVVEQTKQATPYTNCSAINPLFIFGNEVDGVHSETCAEVKEHIYIPMHGTKESLNVGICVAVILYHHIT